MAYLDLNGLRYLYSKLKNKFAPASHTHSTLTTVTLTVAGWSSKTQVVTVNGVTASNLVTVRVNDDQYGIECTTQATNKLTFTCETVPTANVTVRVAIVN